MAFLLKPSKWSKDLIQQWTTTCINALINALCVKNGIPRKSTIFKNQKIKNTVEPMFVHELTKKIANNLKGWSVDLEILCA